MEEYVSNNFCFCSAFVNLVTDSESAADTAECEVVLACKEKCTTEDK